MRCARRTSARLPARLQPNEEASGLGGGSGEHGLLAHKTVVHISMCNAVRPHAMQYASPHSEGPSIFATTIFHTKREKLTNVPTGNLGTGRAMAGSKATKWHARQIWQVGSNCSTDEAVPHHDSLPPHVTHQGP